MLEHARGTLVDSLVERSSIRIQPEPHDAEARQRIPPLLPEFGHLRATGQADLDGANQFGRVVGMDLRGGRRVQMLQDPVKISRAPLCRALAQALAQFLRTLRTCE